MIPVRAVGCWCRGGSVYRLLRRIEVLIDAIYMVKCNVKRDDRRETLSRDNTVLRDFDVHRTSLAIFSVRRLLPLTTV